MTPTATIELVADRQDRYLHEAAQHRLARSHQAPRLAFATRLAATIATRLATRIDAISARRPSTPPVAHQPAACAC